MRTIPAVVYYILAGALCGTVLALGIGTFRSDDLSARQKRKLVIVRTCMIIAGAIAGLLFYFAN